MRLNNTAREHQKIVSSQHNNDDNSNNNNNDDNSYPVLSPSHQSQMESGMNDLGLSVALLRTIQERQLMSLRMENKRLTEDLISMATDFRDRIEAHGRKADNIAEAIGENKDENRRDMFLMR